MSQTRSKCNLYFTTTYTEGILNGTDPILKNELIPVTIENDGTVRVANPNNKWYEYATQQWANAVITQNSYDVLAQEGKVNGAIKSESNVYFDGIDDYINLGLANYDFTNSITLGVKVNFNLDKTKTTSLIGNWESQGGGLAYLANKGIYFNLYDRNKNIYQTIQTEFVPESGKDYVIIGTYDGSNMKLFINGNLVKTLNVSFQIKPSSFPFYLGTDPNANTSFESFFRGNFFQSIVYNRALSEEEIKQISSEIKVINNNGLLKYVDFTNRIYGMNEIIPEEIIESYFVWIPRYKYQIFNDGNYTGLTAVENKVQTINVVFENKDTPVSNGSTVGSWLSHPAFTSFNSNGMWVGKFETGYKGATSTNTAEVNSRDANKIQIKPNIYSWRNIQVANAFYSTYDYKRELDSHMMKNTEWGAVAYLQHSVYGSQQSVRINNNSSYITGYAANDELACGNSSNCNLFEETSLGVDGTNTLNYKNPTSVVASTTGNYSGIYDMSGGSWEYVMGVMADSNGNPMSGRSSTYHSGFKGSYGEGGSNTSGYDWPNNKYYDIYSYFSLDQEFNRRILGDATGEMGPFTLYNSGQIGSWYDDEAWFANLTNPWFCRGAVSRSGSAAGVFAFSHDYGRFYPEIGFRVVLTP